MILKFITNLLDTTHCSLQSWISKSPHRQHSDSAHTSPVTMGHHCLSLNGPVSPWHPDRRGPATSRIFLWHYTEYFWHFSVCHPSLHSEVATNGTKSKYDSYTLFSTETSEVSESDSSSDDTGWYRWSGWTFGGGGTVVHHLQGIPVLYLSTTLEMLLHSINIVMMARAESIGMPFMLACPLTMAWSGSQINGSDLGGSQVDDSRQLSGQQTVGASSGRLIDWFIRNVLRVSSSFLRSITNVETD